MVYAASLKISDTFLYTHVAFFGTLFELIPTALFVLGTTNSLQVSGLGYLSVNPSL